ncbi:MAG: carboxypeptidase [Deltaproteobacteria bacterium]|nr:MAG: carboxypeptidase [Deltaproteobacteria bacterium]
MTNATGVIRIVRAAFYGTLALVSVALLIGVGMFFIALRDLPRVPDPLSRIIETPPTEIFAGTGERLMAIGGREVIPLSNVSTHFIQAILATEDHRFWEHHGVDKLRTLKALWVTLFRPGRIEGASTITQQLSKNLFFSFKRSYMRKFRELLVALQIEARYSKREILETYLNQISMGVGANGIEQAARTFFGKPASDLTLAQSALLAGLPKSPTRYNPYLHLDRAKERQRVVLSRMEAVGYITSDQAQSALQEEIRLQSPSRVARTGSYFLDLVIKSLEERYGPEVVYHGGLKVTTTIDLQLQSMAEESLRGGLYRLDRMVGIDEGVGHGIGSEAARPQGALVALETKSGAVKAMVGGRNYVETEYNRAVESNRLPGSSFKPFLYYTAFEKLGLNPATVFIDKPVTIPVVGAPDWEPENFGRKHEGPMILKQALMKSVNSIAAQLVERTGPEEVIATAKRCGITSELEPVYSVALGTSGVSPLEMASAFACFANGGIRHNPFWIWRVEDALGRVLEEHIISGTRALDTSITYQVLDMMRGVVDAGTGSVIRRMGFDLPAAGKTGTTDGYYDAWFTGFIPTLCTSVWVGYDRGKGLRDTRGTGITGGRAAAPIWADFMRKATEGDPPREFMVPTDIRFKIVDRITGMEATTSTTRAMRVALREGQELPAYGVGKEEGISDSEPEALPSASSQF